MGEGEIEDGRGIVMEVEGAWNLGKMGMVSFMRAGIRMSVSVLMLVVVLVYISLTVWVEVGVLTAVVVVVTMVVQEVLVEIDCVRVVSKSSCGGFVVVMVLEDVRLVFCSG